MTRPRDYDFHDCLDDASYPPHPSLPEVTWDDVLAARRLARDTLPDTSEGMVRLLMITFGLA